MGSVLRLRPTHRRFTVTGIARDSHPHSPRLLGSTAHRGRPAEPFGTYCTRPRADVPVQIAYSCVEVTSVFTSPVPCHVMRALAHHACHSVLNLADLPSFPRSGASRVPYRAKRVMPVSIISHNARSSAGIMPLLSSACCSFRTTAFKSRKSPFSCMRATDNCAKFQPESLAQLATLP